MSRFRDPAVATGADGGQPHAGRAVDRALLRFALTGAAVAIGLGVYGRLHTAAPAPVILPGFSGPLPAKVWLTSAATALALVQLGTALVMYDRIPRLTAPAWTATAHRWSGRMAFLTAVPVALQCLYSLGFQAYDARVLVHSILGCAFFGAFTTKLLALKRGGVPGWAVPLLGGLVFSLMVALWLTSSLWFFTTVGIQR